mmetsp:Transcript_17374/g.32943  ORF Transcript_17374/g.32943 Transcript_17374/m.32943 type:complete len:497 (+) Transcript_17374:106-1596(+)|eukprot:CAMPEP_0176493716 /NCGR_PEP_ID=MMETSP0200_2-20121128/9695_1 /TAXON_ID=947934 /ORGANISM="Chaetoceros sp., Strain GSL56" /LENGTH=496 /DNA_ID=CAMNT_0017891393 /DNA_START=68 /DNA_END=1558 /DNA_ORIENTATION=-
MTSPDSCTQSPPSLTAKGRQRHFVKHSYTDRANELDGPLSKKDEHILSLYDKENVGAGPFPVKLHIVLKIMENGAKDHIVSWLPHGRAFAIHNPKLFESEVMKKYFNQSQISSFRRQLNLYGFIRLSKGRDAGAYYHEFFLRGKPLLSMKMMRERIKGTKIRASSSPAEEPEFYRMPFLGPVNRQAVLTQTNGPVPQLMTATMNNYILGGMGGPGDPTVSGPYVSARPVSMHTISTADMSSSPHTAAAAAGNMHTVNRNFSTATVQNNIHPPTYIHHAMPPQMMNTAAFLVRDNVPNDMMGYTTNGPPFVGQNPRVIYQPVSLMDRNNNAFIVNGQHVIHHPRGNHFIPPTVVSHEPLYALNMNQMHPTIRDGGGNPISSSHHQNPFIVKNGMTSGGTFFPTSSSSMGRMVQGHAIVPGSSSSSSYHPTTRCAPAAPNMSNVTQQYQSSSSSSQMNSRRSDGKNGDLKAASTMLCLGEQAESPNIVSIAPTRALEI